MAVQAGWGIHTEELAGKEYKYRFVAACDIIPERFEKMKERYGCKGYDNIDNLIAVPWFAVKTATNLIFINDL